MQIIPLTPAEEHLMQLLWKLENFYLKDVLGQHPEPKPHQNTISTFLKILVEKEFLSVEKEGRIFKYSIAIPFEDYKNFLLKNFVKNYFSSPKELIKTLISEKLIKLSDLNDFFEIKTTVVPLVETKTEQNPIAEFIEKLTKKEKKKKKKKKKK